MEGILPLAWEKVAVNANIDTLGWYTPTRVGKRLSIFWQN